MRALFNDLIWSFYNCEIKTNKKSYSSNTSQISTTVWSVSSFCFFQSTHLYFFDFWASVVCMCVSVWKRARECVCVTLGLERIYLEVYIYPLPLLQQLLQQQPIHYYVFSIPPSSPLPYIKLHQLRSAAKHRVQGYYQELEWKCLSVSLSLS